ncbi:MAG: GAF domain-containing sensor histidine kinase [Pseudomonadota bacterium]
MKVAPFAPDESLRLAALLEYEVLDTEDEKALDELTALASAICDTPISLISLVDTNRQWFKSRHGIDATETPREIAFCSHAILQPNVLEVPNALEDERFADNPLVTGAPDIRFYAGAPLTTPSGQNLGTLCVIDSKPKKLTQEQRNALEVLSKQVIGQLELRLKTRRLERINKEREQIMAVLAHDLRSPFYGIVELAKMMAQNTERFDEQKMVSLSSTIYDSSLKVYQVLDELLQWSQKQLGAVHCYVSHLSLARLVVDTQNLVCDMFKQKNIQLINKVDNDIYVQADAVLTKTVLRNLMMNAIKYTPKDGTVWIEAEVSENEVHISVQDTGAGINSAIREKLFTSSVKSEKGTAGEKGSGMGLSLCYEFVDMQNGKIWLDQSITEGTRIVFSLPNGHRLRHAS